VQALNFGAFDHGPDDGVAIEMTRDPMPNADPRAAADQRFAAALAEAGARDPRDYYRERLATLRGDNPDAFKKARTYFDETLIPEVAREGSDPLGAWLEYGRLLASLLSAGEAVQVDRTGRSWPYRPPVPLDHLVLHLPQSSRDAVIPVGLPPQLSPAQRATYDLLVLRKVG
jgi:hypothetical protein